jgi:hypothetical protein
MIVKTMSSKDTKKELPPVVYKFRDRSKNDDITIITEQIVFMTKSTTFEDPKYRKLKKRYYLITDEEIYRENYHISKGEHLSWTEKQHISHAQKLSKNDVLLDLN